MQWRYIISFQYPVMQVCLLYTFLNESIILIRQNRKFLFHSLKTKENEEKMNHFYLITKNRHEYKNRL